MFISWHFPPFSLQNVAEFPYKSDNLEQVWYLNQETLKSKNKILIEKKALDNRYWLLLYALEALTDKKAKIIL